MTSRYQDPKIAEIFSEDRKYTLWLLIEEALIKALAPEDLSKPFSFFVLGLQGVNLTSFINACKHEEAETKHDVGAFLNVLESRLDATGSRVTPFLHRGFTSSDVVDTATCLQAHAARRHVAFLVRELKEAIGNTGDAKCVGYTHGMPAEMMCLSSRFQRALSGLHELPSLRPHLTGPLGDAKHLDIGTRIEIARLLGFNNDGDGRAPAQPNFMQCSERSDYARLASAIAINGGVLAKLALDLRLLVFKGEMGREKGGHEMGSSAMPHKTNPADLEKVCGLARVLRGNAMVAMENIELWLERDISHSSTERMWLPESFHLYCHMLTTMTKAVLNYRPTVAMKANLENYSDVLQTAAHVIELQRQGSGRRAAWLKVRGKN